MKGAFLIFILTTGVSDAFGQARIDSLFGIQAPLDIGISISINEIKNSKHDSMYLSHKLYYRNPAGIYDSMQVELRGRGNFRFRECYFPPMRIKINSKNAKQTIFEGNKKLKLVLHCHNRSGHDALVLKEYLCYKFYEQISPFAFQTRLVQIDLTELRGNKKKNYKLKGILIEDLAKAANRLGTAPLKNAKIHQAALNDTSSLRFALFQFMISNTDWSEIHQHNAKLVHHPHGKYISIPYDFDMSGLVDAPYSVVSQINGEQLNIRHVTERLYRGYCRSPQLTEFERQEFLAKKERLLALPDQLKGSLTDKEIKGIKNYLEKFFDILKDDRLFKRNILDQCRLN